MPTHKQKLKDRHSQPEPIVLLRAINVAKSDALQFGWRVFRKSSFAAICLAVEPDLEAVDVQQIDRRLPRDQDVFGIHVSDDQTMFVYGRDGSRDIGRDVNQERPRSSGEFLQSALGAVQRMNLFGLANLFHHEAGDLSVRRVTQRRYRPGRKIEESFITE